MTISYRCPHCGTNQFLTYHHGYTSDGTYKDLPVSGVLPTPQVPEPCLGTRLQAFVCCHCREPSIIIEVVLKQKSKVDVSGHRTHTVEGTVVKKYYAGRIYPRASVPIVHPSVPESLAADYKEAWSILELSSKSSAVLARRCVQGAIRNFCGIAKDTLNQEINELERRYHAGELGNVTPYITAGLLEAIDNVRRVGNIGAHMGKNVNKVIPIAHDEAKLLLQLVGYLFTEWYEAKSEREARLQNLMKVAAEKAEAKVVDTPEPAPVLAPAEPEQ